MFAELLKLCQEKQKTGNIYIQTHNFPDPDAIATSFGLQQLLRRCGVESTICYEGRIDKVNTAMMVDAFGIELYEYDELRSRMRDEDSIICVDSQKHGGNITDFIGDEIACIDHHPVYVEPNYQYADLRITGACATIITEYWLETEYPLDTATATALLYGIKMDTAALSRGVTPLDVDMFCSLFPLRDEKTLSVLEHSSLKLQDLRAYGAAIEGIQLYDFFGFSYIPFSCPDALVAAVSDFILSLAEVEVTVTCAERTDGYKLSVRSERADIHAGDLVRAALDGLGNGGGHAAMAGGFIKREEMERLTKFPRDLLRDRFLAAWKAVPPMSWKSK